MIVNHIYSAQMRASDFAICTFFIILKKFNKIFWGMTINEWEILFMTINNWYYPFSFTIHEQALMIFSKMTFANLSHCPIWNGNLTDACFCSKRTAHSRHLCRKTASCHRCGWKNEQHLNIVWSFEHQMSLSKSKCCYSNNCLHFWSLRQLFSCFGV